MSKKIVRRQIPNKPELANFHPLLQRIYAARDVHGVNDIDRELNGLESYKSLKGIDAATARLQQALMQQQRILIVGDFDADGATSAALAVSALRAFGAKHVDFVVPSRFAFGYGLTPEIVDYVKDREPQVIITVDNGIASIAGVARANELGIDVVITDHHLAPKELPQAYAIVNPNQPGDEFPCKNLAGVGVIFYVMIALRAELSATNWFSEQQIECPQMSQFLDLVALGTVADVVPLDKINRILVYQGLRRIRAGHACAGVLALLKIANRQYERAAASDLSFAVAPRLNAAGRLDDMTLGIECLLSTDFRQAIDIAKQLNSLNYERRMIEGQMREEAFAIVDKLHLDKNLPMGICLYDETWHQGVVGLVAARVKEKFHRPVIAFAKADDGNLKGSARSITCLHIRDVLENIATAHPELITKFGGHAMAAGLTLAAKDFDRFSNIFAKEVAKKLSEDDLQEIVYTDGELNCEEYSLEVADMLREAGPWGQGFPMPRFDGVFEVVDQYLISDRHLKINLRIPQKEVYVQGIMFNVDQKHWPNRRCRRVQLAYTLGINDYHGRQQLQLLIDEIQPASV